MVFKWNLYRLSSFRGVKILVRSILKWLSIFNLKIVKDSQRQWKHWNKVTFNESSFDREYESKWSGTVEDAFFRAEQFDRARILN